MKEIWKDIPGYEGHYQISNLSRVKSLKLKTEKILIQSVNNIGYKKVTLSLNNKLKNYNVHRLLMMCFIPNPNNYPQVNHINGIKTDNRIENLEWCTTQYNTKHAQSIGLIKPVFGEDNFSAKLTNKIVLEIRKLFNNGYNKSEISRMIKVPRSTIADVIKRRTWRHI